MHLGGSGRRDDFAFAGARPSVRDVLGNAGREQHRLLQHQRELVPQIGQLVVPQIHAIEQNLSYRRIVKTRQQAHQSGFPRASGAGDPETGARLDFKE